MALISILSIISVVYCICVIVLVCLAKYHHPSTPHQNELFAKLSRFREWLSAICMLSATMSALMLLLSYFTPTILNHCRCHLLFGLTIAFYVVSIYALKFCFALHCFLVLLILRMTKKGSQNDSFFEDKTWRYKWYFVFIILAIIGIISTILVTTFSDGQCDSDLNGCHISFKPWNAAICLGLAICDLILLTLFTMYVYTKLRKNEEELSLIIHFLLTWLVTSIAFIGSITDISINIAYPGYNTLVFVLIDCMLFTTCSFIAFSPGHYYAAHLCCWYRIVTFRQFKTRTATATDIETRESPECEDKINKKIIQVIKESELSIEFPSTPMNSYDQAHTLSVELKAIPETCTSSPQIGPMKIPTTRSNRKSSDGESDILPTIESYITSINEDFVTEDAVVVECPSCNSKLIIRDEDDKWQILKLHIKTFHFNQ